MAHAPQITIPILPLPDGREIAVDVQRDPAEDSYSIKIAGSLLDELSDAKGIWQLSHAIATALSVARGARAAR